MKEMRTENVNGIEFESINEFLNYTDITPVNYVFSNSYRERASNYYHSDNWAGTRNLNEAMELLRSGWKEGTEKLINAMKLDNMEIGKIPKQFYDVVGYQCSVPRYLQGIPTNMVNSKKVATKQRIVTITKSINYSSGFEPSKILEESKKALQIVQKIEAQGIRVNLNILYCARECNRQRSEDRKIFVKIRIKSANERLNISKVAFPLIHPSMLRRLILKFVEVYPPVPQYFTKSYGRPDVDHKVRELGILGKDEVLIPIVFTKDINTIKSIEDLM